MVRHGLGMYKLQNQENNLFNDHAFQKNIGNYANYMDIENGEEYWISGFKKRKRVIGIGLVMAKL